MSQPFLIVNIVDGELNCIRQRKDWVEALKVAVDMAAEQVIEDPQADESETFIIRQEITNELGTTSEFTTPSGDVRVYITSAMEEDAS